MKNNHLTLLLLSVLLLSLASCDDSIDETTAKGFVLEYGTETPVEGAQVVLYKKEAQLSGGYSVPIDTIITDETGYYEFVYIDEAGFFYDIDIRKDTYFDLTYRGLQANQVNETNLFLDPIAALELHIKNINPFDGNDYFNINGSLDGPWYGENIDVRVTLKVRGNQEKQITSFITKNGISDTKVDLIYCKGHELTKYELFY